MSTSGSPSVFAQTRAPNEDWLSRAEPERVLDPDLPIVDAHMHLWHHKTGYRYFVEEFANDLTSSGHNVEATIFIECHSMYRARGPEHLKWVGETEFAVGMAAMAASGKYTSSRVADGVIGYADLTIGELLCETLDAHLDAGRGRFKGVRQRAKWDADRVVRGTVGADRPGLYLEPAFGAGLDKLSSLGLVFEASVYHPQLPDVIALARSHPDAKIVLVNSGSPVGHSSYAGRDDEVHAQWLSGMKGLAACQNVMVKLGGILMSIGNFDFTTAEAPPTSVQLAELWRPYIEPCIELFGVDRCMVSSNFPVDKAGFAYGTVWNMFKRIAAGCSVDEKNRLFSGTAKRLYDLN